ncbi:copper amine oxidase domain protein [Paenibacillus curdlanolyticus YK9]|uniref:Copper amine oxidase domain protein n=1 Tax=Paenibacillus curdlanolyticus YK9 TaxID=717606 RepID=E0I7K8_9BACL|nr:copper amine oxidase [Paenibacillus curdlanolyticus]EFM11561.1 copper amine oxidase domain protein [Paenibacillus curdlanolyticus YK9]
MKRLFILLMAAVLLLGVLPAAASAAEPNVNIKLSVGSSTLTVNGVNSTIQKPIQENGTTMVPLSVITKAFGAGLKLENNKIITLTYNGTTVVLTLGSKTVKVNGKDVVLTAAPKVVNGVTMVPLRVIASAFGATLSVNGSVITITGMKASGNGGTGSGINPDAGKSKVGDSYYGWSMNYPSGLTLVNQSASGNVSTWRDVQDLKMIFVAVDDMESELSKEEIREELLMYSDYETVIDKRTIVVGGVNIERVITKDNSGWFYEYRGLQSNGKLYTVIGGMKTSSKDNLKQLQTLLDSFKPSFDKSDKKLKDVSKVVNGMVKMTSPAYGLVLQLPVGWSGGQEPMYYNMADHSSLMFKTTSLVEGDTLDQWLSRIRKRVETGIAKDYFRNMTESELVLKDGTAKVLTYEVTFDKKEWTKQREILLVVNKFRYAFSYSSPADGGAEADKVFAKIMSTVDIDTKYIEANFSSIEDETDLLEAPKLLVKKSKKYGYTVSIPSDWSGYQKDFEKPSIYYANDMGDFAIDIDEGKTIQDAIKEMTNDIKDLQDEEDANITLKDEGDVKFGSNTWRKLSVYMTESYYDDLPYTMDVYMIERNGKLYSITTSIYDMNVTEQNLATLRTMLESFAFTS